MKLKDVVETLKKCNPKDRISLAYCCRAGRIKASYIGSEWDVDEELVNEAFTWYATSFDITELPMPEAFCAFDDKTKALCKRRIHTKSAEYVRASNKYSVFFKGKLVGGQYKDLVDDIVARTVEEYNNREKLVIITEAAKMLNMSVYKLKREISEGNIKAKRVINDWYICEEDIKDFQAFKSSYIGSFDLIKEIVINIDTFFDPDDESDRYQLNLFLRNLPESREFITWKEAGYGSRRNAYYIPILYKESISTKLKSYFDGYGSVKEKIEKYKQHEYFVRCPETKDVLEIFAEKKPPYVIKALYEIVINSFDKEIVMCSNDDIKRAVYYAENCPEIIYKHILASFLNYVQSRYDCSFNIQIKFPKASRIKTVNTEPYSTAQFLAGARLVFNEQFIKENDLITKAINTPKYAYIWLYVIWHYLCTWRASDFKRLKIISLLSPNEKVLEMIKTGTYAGEANKISLILEAEINNRKTRMHKTQDKQDSEFLTVHIPESLREVVGTVYSIYVIHANCSRSFQQQSINARDYVNFFGPDYKKSFGDNVYSNRRGNKAFMNIISEIVEASDPKGNKLLGYTVAQFARGHVASKDGISSMTSRYLQTKMDGLTPNEILMLLWDSGCCSFVPYMLLQIIYGDKFIQLPVKDQTEVLAISGLNAYSSEMMVKTVHESYYRAKSTMDSLFKQFFDSETKRIMSKQIIGNMLTKRAQSKQIGVLCIMSAMKKPCVFVGKQDCWGCPYAIYERACLMYGVDKIKEIQEKKNKSKTPAESRKYEEMLDKMYLPCMLDILVFCNKSYGMDISPYQKSIIEILSNERKLSYEASC